MAQRSVLSVIREHAGTVVHGFLLGERDLTPVDTPTLDQAVQCTLYLVHMDRRIDLWIGRLLIYCEGRWGDTYIRLVEATGLDYGTLRNLKWVVSAVDSRWRPSLGFAHHQHVAPLPPDDQERLLDQAVRETRNHRWVKREAYKLTHTMAPPQGLTPDPHLYCGDCRHILDRLPDTSVGLLLTDPPYGLNYISPTRIVPFDRMENDNPRDAAAVLDGALGRAAPKLKPNSYICVFGSWKTCSQMVEVVANHFAVLERVVWIKNNWGVGDLRGAYGEQHELVILAHNGSRHSSDRPDPLGGALHFDRVGNERQHPTQKPVPLLRHLITTLSCPGDTVLDPFMGGGSTCVAAHNTGRGYVGIEINEDRYKIALQRVADAMSED